jgi:N-acetyl-gamma-glutamyl-phosphate reductase common form
VSSTRKRIGIVGARGYVGQELVALVKAHPQLELAFASSRSDEKPLAPADIPGQRVDALVLAMPNGEAAPYVGAVDARTVVVDLSADSRFDDAWVYGLTEHARDKLRGATRISNPGCYATGAQLALRPLLDLIEGVPHVFGISGYSGAGTKKSDKNDPEKLKDSVVPYALVDHMHEREVARHLRRPVAFMPHVAPFFRGITLTVSFSTRAPVSRDEVHGRVARAYHGERLVRVMDGVPNVREAAGQHGATVGGVAVDAAGTRVALVCTLDNLLKGAATQALQNVNLALGLDELAGIPA